MENLQIVWFVLWAVLWMIYFALDGFDLGGGIIMNFIARTDNEKRAIINSVGPFWDGNEVWLITAGGATFAAFPIAYANMFSWLYIPLFLVLAALILRGVSFEFRGKMKNKLMWDVFIFIGSFFPTLLFGVAFGNFWAGLPVDQNGYTLGVLGLLNFHGILSGAVFVVFFVFHSLLWLCLKLQGEFEERVYRLAGKFWYAAIFSLAFFFIFLPLRKNPNFVQFTFSGYLSVGFYLISLVSLILIKKRLDLGKILSAFVLSMCFIMSWLAGGFSGQYPNLIPSSIAAQFNVSAFNSSSGFYTLKIMTWVAAIFVPIVIFYQLMVYKMLSHKINAEKEDTLHY